MNLPRSIGNFKITKQGKTYDFQRNILISGSLLKCTNGLTLDYDTAKEDLKVVKTKRYTTAYIVAIKDGKNISIQEALNNYNKSNILY